MLPVHFIGCNTNYGPPHGWTNEECDTVPAFKFYCEDCECMHSMLKLQLNLEDLNSINRNLPIFIQIVGVKSFPFFIYAGELECKVNFESSGIDAAGKPYQFFYIILTDEQKEEINNSGFIMYKVNGPTIQPFNIYTVDEQGNGNF